MNALRIHLNRKVSALSLEHRNEYAVFRVLCFSAVFLVVVYLYLVSASVLNVIAQKEADATSSALESNLGELEAQYFALSKNITPEHASNLGFTALSDSSFVYRLNTVGVVASANNAI